jgi:hypothetical protein
MKYWKTDNNFYPEKEYLINKNDIGISFSGGGFRAMTLMVGWNKAIKDKYAYEKVKYLSSVSGGSWFNLLLTYSREIKFNNILHPKDCTINNLKIVEPKSYNEIITNANVIINMLKSITINEFFNSNIKKNFWINTILVSLYKDLSIKDINIIPKIDDMDIINLPYPIINATVKTNKTNNNNFFPIEFTPLYYAIPLEFIDDNKVEGGYFIEPEYFIKDDVISPSVQSAISSSCICAAIELVGKSYERSWDIYNPLSNSSSNYKLFDGADYDNTGILALLRRKTKNIISLNSCTHEITSLSFTNKLFGDCDLTNLFANTDNPNNLNNVFSEEAWNEVYNIMKNKIDNGQPASALIHTTTLENKELGIEAYDVNVLFIFNSLSTNWYNDLPVETQKYMDKHISDYPFISTFYVSYDPILTNLLMSQAYWQIINTPELNEIFNN